MFGNLKVPMKISVPFKFDSFSDMAIQFSFEESEFGKIKSSP